MSIGGKQYLDYLADSESMSGQTIEFVKNLLVIKKFTKNYDITTAIIPLETKLEDANDGASETHLTVESFNDGKDYLYDETAIQTYGGFIFKKLEYPNVTLPRNLSQRGYRDLEQVVRLGLTIELMAFNMSLLDINIGDFREFEYVGVVSALHDLVALFLVSKMTIHLSDQSRNKLIVGKNFNYLTTEQNTTEKIVNRLIENVEETEAVSREIIDNVNKISARTDNY